MSDELKKRQEEKMQFKVNDCDWHIMDTIAFLDLYKDDRLKELMHHLKNAHEEINKLKESNYAFPKQMNNDTRAEIANFLIRVHKDQAFGDGMEEEYVADGMYFKGIHNLNDEELLEEFGQVIYFDEGSDEEELYNRAKAEMELNNAIDS